MTAYLARCISGSHDEPTRGLDVLAAAMPQADQRIRTSLCMYESVERRRAGANDVLHPGADSWLAPGVAFDLAPAATLPRRDLLSPLTRGQKRDRWTAGSWNRDHCGPDGTADAGDRGAVGARRNPADSATASGRRAGRIGQAAMRVSRRALPGSQRRSPRLHTRRRGPLSDLRGPLSARGYETGTEIESLNNLEAGHRSGHRRLLPDTGRWVSSARHAGRLQAALAQPLEAALKSITAMLRLCPQTRLAFMQMSREGAWRGGEKLSPARENLTPGAPRADPTQSGRPGLAD